MGNLLSSDWVAVAKGSDTLASSMLSSGAGNEISLSQVP